MDPEAYAKNNKPENGSKVGVYKHEATSEELWASSFPQADALVRQGWVYSRPLPSAEELRQADLKASRAAEAAKKAETPDADTVKKLRAELKDAKAAKATAEAAQAEAEAETKQAQEDAEAALKVAAEAEKARTDANKNDKETE